MSSARRRGVGSNSVLFGLSEGEVVVDFVGVAGGDEEDGSMTMRRRVGWRACRDMLAIVGVWRSSVVRERLRHRASESELVG